jgi:hypothetical protein
MLNTDAYVFLNIRDPLCAWSTYRSVLVAAQDAPGFLSVWTAGRLRLNNDEKFGIEIGLEKVRRQHHPTRVSRLRGMYCFLDLGGAERALSWGNHFRPEFLAELSLAEAGARRDRLDANWITHRGGKFNDWMDRYWRGEAFPDDEPLWETIVDGRMIVLGTTLRERAYQVIKRDFPESLTFLEIARLAASVGSDLGNIAAHLRQSADDFILDYVMDMRDAENPDFHEKLRRAKEAGEPVNTADLTPIWTQGTFGRTMDLRRFGFRRPKAEMPYLLQGARQGDDATA